MESLNENFHQFEHKLDKRECPEESNGVGDNVTNKMTWEGIFHYVLEIVLANLDVRSLKTCRLVSKKWNKEASKELRNRSFTCLVNNKVKGCRNSYADFNELMKTRDKSLPVPFEFFDIYSKDHNLKEFFDGVENILQEISVGQVKGKVRKLRVGPAKRDKHLYPFLEKHSKTLTHFVVDNGYYCELPEERPNNLSCTLLTSLTFGISEVTEGATNDWIIQLINNTQRLHHVMIYADRRTNHRNLPGADVLLQLMTLPNFKTIRSLSVDIFSPIAAKSLISGLKLLQQLVSLVFRCKPIALPDDDTIDLLQTLHRFSEHIQYFDFGNLQLDRDIIDENFPDCQCLESLKIWKFQPGSKYFGRAPNLKNVAFYQNFDVPVITESIDCHEGVETIDMDECKSLSPSDFSLLQKQFPECRKLSMHASLACCYLNASLKDKSIAAGWTKLDSLELSGHDVTASKKALELISKREVEIQRKNALSSDARMSGGLAEIGTGLKTLVLNWHFLNDDMIMELESVASLEILHIRWGKYLKVGTLVDVVKTMGSLKEVVVTNCCDSKFKMEMETLYSTLPLVRCGCKLDFQKRVQRFGS